MQWGKKRNKKQQRPDLFDYDASDTPHIEPKTARSMRRVVYTDVQKRNESNRKAQKRLVSEYKSRQSLLANEYNREPKPDYSNIFEFDHDGLSSKHPQIEASLRQWIRYGLTQQMTYDQIKTIVMSEFRLHRDIIRKP